MEIMVPSCRKSQELAIETPPGFVLLCWDAPTWTRFRLKQRKPQSEQEQEHTPGTGWEQERAAPACTPGLRSEPAVPCRTWFHTEQETLPAGTTKGSIYFWGGCVIVLIYLLQIRKKDLKCEGIINYHQISVGILYPIAADLGTRKKSFLSAGLFCRFWTNTMKFVCDFSTSTSFCNTRRETSTLLKRRFGGNKEVIMNFKTSPRWTRP